MSNGANEIENRLRESYEQQAASYAQALIVAESLLANWQPGQNVPETLGQINSIMDQIAVRNRAIEGLRQQWLDNRQKPGPLLDAALKKMTQFIERLAGRIRELEKLASACKDQLAPQLDDMMRGRQMQRAYATAAARPNRRV
jgi:hypothetical protein